jgi:hypothetical protein
MIAFEVYALLVAFQVKHFLADYPLQNAFHLGKNKPWPDFVGPLLSHAACHAILTMVVAGAYILLTFGFKQPPYLAILLGAADFVLHAAIDRIKAAPSLGGRFNPSQKGFWVSLGADQMAHHLTHYLLIFLLLRVGE